MADNLGAGGFDPDAAAIPQNTAEVATPLPSPPPADLNPLGEAGGGTTPGPLGRMPTGAPTTGGDPFAQPAWPEIADAAFAKSNTIASTLSFISQRSKDFEYDPGWNPATLLKGSEFANQPELFEGDLNKDQTAAKMMRMRSDAERGRVLAASGSAGVAMGLAAGVLDPVNYAPIFGEYTMGARGAQIAYDAARMGAFGAATAGVSESILHATQEDRTWKESAGNIAGATLLMGILGGVTGMLSPIERAAAATDIDAIRPKLAADPATGATVVHAPEEIPDNLFQLTTKPEATPPAATIGPAATPAAGMATAQDMLSDFEGTMRGGSIDAQRFSQPPTTDELDQLLEKGRAFQDSETERLFGEDAPQVKEWLRRYSTSESASGKLDDLLYEKYGYDSEQNHFVFGTNGHAIFNEDSIKELRDQISHVENGVSSAARGDTEPLAKELAWAAPKLPDPAADIDSHTEQERVAVLSLSRAFAGLAEHGIDPMPVLNRAVEYTVHRVNGDASDARLLLDRLSGYAKQVLQPQESRAAAPQAQLPAPTVKRPQTLLDWLKSNGGVKDEGGELTVRGLVRGYPGLVNNKSGMSIDMARRQAAQAGFLGHHIERAMNETLPADLFDKIDRHPTYSIHDEDQHLAYQVQEQLKEQKAAIADATDQLTSHLNEYGAGVTDKEHLHEAAQIMVHEGLSADDALEQAAIRSLDDEGRAIGKKKGIPDHEIPELDAGPREPDQGGLASEGPGAEGEAGAARGEVPDRGAAAKFTTAKGSTYEVHADGTTTRNKAARSDVGHEGDSGPKPRSERTIYVDKDQASALSGAGLAGADKRGFRVVIGDDGKATLVSWNEKQQRWGASPDPRNIPFSDKPEIGKAPVELWKKSTDVPGREAYAGQHAGNEIVSVTQRAPPDSSAAQGVPRAVGAAPSDGRDLVLKNYGLNQLGRLSEATIDRLSPALRVFSRGTLAAKRAMADLAETALKFTQHDLGLPTSLQQPLEGVFRTMQRKAQFFAHNTVKENWFTHRFGDAPPTLGQRASTAVADMRGPAPNGKLSFRDFKYAVSDAMRAGDVHSVPEVQEAAKSIRQIFDQTGKMAEETIGPDGLPMLNEYREPPKGDQSFLPRSWNKQAIIRKRGEFVKTTADWLEDEQGRHADIQNAIGKYRDAHEKSVQRQAELTEQAAGLERGSKARADLEYEARLEAAKQDTFRSGIEDQLREWGGNTTDTVMRALKKRDLAEAKGGREFGVRDAALDSHVDEAVERIMGRTDLDLSREEIETLANEITDRIINTPDGRIPYAGDHITDSGSGPVGGGGNQPRGSLNAREWAIPSATVRDFLQNDIEHIVGTHLRTVVPDVLLTQRFGDVRMTDTIRSILDEYAGKIAGAKTEAERVKLNKLKDRDIQDVTAVRDRLRGIYGWNPDPSFRKVGETVHAFHNWTTITALGTSALNRINDWGMQSVMRNGFMNTMSDMWAPMLKGMLGMTASSREAIAQARDMGIGIDGMLGHSRYNLADVTDAYQPGNTFTRGLAWTADRSMLVNLHGPATDYARIFNWIAAQGEFGRVAERIAGGGATAKDFARMADANIDPHMATRIWAQYAEHHNVVEGTRFANAGKWTDTVARDVFERAMQREANINVIQAGIGDKPLFLSKPLGSLIGQFKSFTAGATERLLIANLQQGDARTFQGAITGITMGMIGYRLYTLASGQPVSDRPQDWLKEGIVRSGMGGWLTEANATAAKFTSGKSDAFRLIGADRPTSRRASESALSDLLGPTFSHLEAATTALGHATYTDPKTGKTAFTARDIHGLRQAGLLPVPPFVFQNLMGLRRIGDQFEDGIAQSLGLKPMNRQPHWNP